MENRHLDITCYVMSHPASASARHVPDGTRRIADGPSLSPLPDPLPCLVSPTAMAPATTLRRVPTFAIAAASRPHGRPTLSRPGPLPSISTLLAPSSQCAPSQGWLVPQHAAVCRSFPSSVGTVCASSVATWRAVPSAARFLAPFRRAHALRASLTAFHGSPPRGQLACSKRTRGIQC